MRINEVLSLLLKFAKVTGAEFTCADMDKNVVGPTATQRDRLLRRLQSINQVHGVNMTI